MYEDWAQNYDQEICEEYYTFAHTLFLAISFYSHVYHSILDLSA